MQLKNLFQEGGRHKHRCSSADWQKLDWRSCSIHLKGSVKQPWTCFKQTLIGSPTASLITTELARLDAHWLHNLHFSQTWAPFIKTFEATTTLRTFQISHQWRCSVREVRKGVCFLLLSPIPPSHYDGDQESKEDASTNASTSFPCHHVMPCLRCLWLWIIKVTRKHLWEQHCTASTLGFTMMHLLVLLNVPFTSVVDSNPFSAVHWRVVERQSGWFGAAEWLVLCTSVYLCE